MKGAYAAAAPVPGGAATCDGSIPGSTHVEAVKLPAAGRMTAELSELTGDWDFYLRVNGSDVSASEAGDVGGTTDAKEIVSAKIKKATAVQIMSCNWAGGPSGAVTWTFTPNK